MEHRRKYSVRSVCINHKNYTEVIISDHYEKKHKSHMNDELILVLVMKLDNHVEVPVFSDGDFQYFTSSVEFMEKPYKLVWLLEKEKNYVGVINAYRIQKRR